MIPECVCDWQYVWHWTGPNKAMQERDCTLTQYSAECTVGNHAQMARLLGELWHREAADTRKASTQ